MGKNRRFITSGKMECSRILNCRDILYRTSLATVMTAVIAWLFYDSFWGMFCGIAVFPMVWRLCQKEKKKKRQQRLQWEFKEYMYVVGSAMMAGCSPERAFSNGLKEIKHLYGEESLLAELLSGMEKRLGLKEPLEHILRDFAEESGCEDIENFVEVFCYAKRSGGNFWQIIQTTIHRIGDKIEILQEIQMVMAEKALEEKIMCIIPIGILIFFRLTSPDFIEVLYGNLLGIGVMTVALFLYGAAFLLAQRLVEIEV